MVDNFYSVTIGYKYRLFSCKPAHLTQDPRRQWEKELPDLTFEKTTVITQSSLFCRWHCILLTE